MLIYESTQKEQLVSEIKELLISDNVTRIYILESMNDIGCTSLAVYSFIHESWSLLNEVIEYLNSAMLSSMFDLIIATQ